MAKVELRKPIDTLINERSRIEQKMTETVDRYTLLQTQLQEQRQEQYHCREAKQSLSNSNMNKPARQVFDMSIASCQLKIDEFLKQLDAVEKERIVYKSRFDAISKSIKELQNT